MALEEDTKRDRYEEVSHYTPTHGGRAVRASHVVEVLVQDIIIVCLLYLGALKEGVSESCGHVTMSWMRGEKEHWPQEGWLANLPPG